jgi:hypothetical protein
LLSDIGKVPAVEGQHHTHAFGGPPDRHRAPAMPQLAGARADTVGLLFACGPVAMPAKFAPIGAGCGAGKLSAFFVAKMLQNAIAGYKCVVDFQNSWKKYCVFILLKQ